MRNWSILVLLLIVSFSCKKSTDDPMLPLAYVARDSIVVSLDEFPINGTTIRAIDVVNDSIVWFAGSNGKWGYTLDNGKNWTIETFNQVQPKPDFRSISVLENGDVFLVSVTNPAVVFKSGDMGLTWNKVYEDTTPNAFFDAIEFWDTNSGILLGDPVDSCFHVAVTNDGGETWQKVECSNLPKSFPGEYPFAASNTNISLFGNNAWFGTGGPDGARVYYSNDKGDSWDVANTDIVNGGAMTGIYSIDFYDNSKGIVGGGDWDNLAMNNKNFALTTNGGKTWTNVGDGTNDGYAACVQFIEGTQGKELFYLKFRAAGGPSSMSYSNDNGNSWQILTNTNDSYLSIQFVNKNTAWLSGKNKIAKMIIN